MRSLSSVVDQNVRIGRHARYGADHVARIPVSMIAGMREFALLCATKGQTYSFKM